MARSLCIQTGLVASVQALHAAGPNPAGFLQSHAAGYPHAGVEHDPSILYVTDIEGCFSVFFCGLYACTYLCYE